MLALRDQEWVSMMGLKGLKYILKPQGPDSVVNVEHQGPGMCINAGPHGSRIGYQ